MSLVSITPPPSRENVLSVYRRIRRKILSGQLRSGQILSQVRLAQEFETSRGPVREALRMLQRDGLIEAETNQQGRIATFSAEDLEQVCALLLLNVTAATRMGAERFTHQDTQQIGRIIDRIEALAATHMDSFSVQQTERRQLAFRRLVRLTCQYAGPFVIRTIDDLLDRLAMFRQMQELTSESPPYPLVNKFPELRAANSAHDANAMALVLLDMIASVSKRAIKYMADRYETRLLDTYGDIARASFGTPTMLGVLESTAVTIRIEGRPGGRVAYEVVTP